MNIRSLPQRIGTSSVVVIGIAGVVAVLISVLAMSTGLIRTLQRTGPENRAIVVRTGSSAELISVLTNEAALAIARFRRHQKGQRWASAGLARRPVDRESYQEGRRGRERAVSRHDADGLRGTPGNQDHQRPRIQPGVTEMIVGKSAQRLYKGLDVGSQDSNCAARLGRWSASSKAAAAAANRNCMADKQTLNSAYQRGNSVQSVLGGARSADRLSDLQGRHHHQSAVAGRCVHGKGFRRAASRPRSARFLKIVAYVVGGIMAVGAIFGALNTMYSAVSARSREIATLRAIGFGPVSVVISVFVEALLLALVGGALGALARGCCSTDIPWTPSAAAFGGQLIFDLAVTPALVAIGIIWACAIGVIGGLFPAIRAARLPVATALRAV